MRGTTEKAVAARTSIISNIALVLGKGLVGVASGSVSVFAEAVHSAVDLIAAIIAYISVRLADAPADESHAYGHGKYENLSGTVEAILILAAAGYIVYEAVSRLIHGTPVEQLSLGMGVMALSATVNWMVSARLFKVARQTDSVALEADGYHLRLDVYTSLGVLVGLAAVRVTGLVMIDRLFGIGVAIWIAWIGIRLSKQAVGPLMDLQLPPDEVEQITSILHDEPRVLGFHKLRTRKSGAHRHIDVHLIVPSDMSLTAAHELAECVEDKIRSKLDNVSVLTHVEPEGE